MGGESQESASAAPHSEWSPRREKEQDNPDLLPTSALTGQGLDDLRRTIAARLRSQTTESEVHTLGSRFREGLDRAKESIQTALAIATATGGEELIAAELHRAIDDLGALVGAVVTEDILDRIFRRFCVGK